MNREELRNLPPMLGIQEAGKLLGFSRQHAYSLARDGEFPTPVHRVGKRYKVPTAPLLRYLEIDEPDHTRDTHGLTTDGEAVYSRAVRRSLDMTRSDEPVTITLNSGKRMKVYPNHEYKYKGRRGVLGADIIADRTA